MFTEAENALIVEALRHSLTERSDDVVAVIAIHGTLQRLSGGLHVRDLEAIRDALQDYGRHGCAAQCLFLIAKIAPLIAAAPPFPQPVDFA